MCKGYVLIPLAGIGARFESEGYSLPKQLLPIMNQSTLEYSLESINVPKDFHVIVLMRPAYFNTHDLRPIFKKAYGDNLSFVEVFEKTKGSLDTCLLAKPCISDNKPLHIFTLDVHISPKIDISKINFEECDATISVVKINNPGFSYAEIDSNNYVTRTAEKLVISNWGATGLYSFNSSKLFFKMAENHIENSTASKNGEFYITPLYNDYIKEGKRVLARREKIIYSFGTPAEYRWCTKNLKENIKRIGIASDHSGYKEKLQFKKFLTEYNLDVTDVGSHSNTDCDYPDYVKLLCDLIETKKVDIGISFCRSGQGVNIVANKHKGIISVLFFNMDQFIFHLKHNNPNHLSIPSMFISEICTEKFINNLLNTKFDGGRHQDRIISIEKNLNK